MTVKTSYAPGEPIWIDLGSPDLDASRRFYGELFGWTAQEGNADFGGYTNFERDGHLVAGLMPLMAPGQPPAWQCYVCTADAAKTSELVESAGGTVIQGSMEVGELGTMAVYTDSVGAFFGVWQPAQHLGAELVDDEGTLTWIELSAKDLDGAKRFYDAVFGWGANASDDYTEFQQAGSSVAGLMAPPPGAPGGMPSYWMPYFAAGDPGAQADKAASLGGTVLVPVREFPGGTFAVVQDPHGATFGLLALKGSA